MSETEKTSETRIDLGNNWSVEPDPSCWILKETIKTKNKDTGKEGGYDKASYYPNLEFALRAYADEKLKGVDPTGILPAIKELQADIRATLEQYADVITGHGRILDRPVEKKGAKS